MIELTQHKISTDKLLKRFNNRDNVAFGEIYNLLYNELFHFTSRLYRDTEIVASDVIHDIFINIWENSTQRFVTIDNLKAYIYISIKNKFRNYIDHQKSKNKYYSYESNRFVLDMVESETLSIITQAIDLLPNECARVFKLHLDGWPVKDIAQQLGKTESTVYTQKQDAIGILKKKLSKHNFSLVSPFL